MVVDRGVPPALHLQIDQAVPRKEVQHVIEKRDGRIDPALPFPVQTDRHGNFRLRGFSSDGRLSHGPASFR